MNFFLSYYPRYASNSIKKLLKKSINNLDIVYNNMGIIIYRTDSHWSKIKNLEFFMSSFLLIKYFTKKVELKDLFNWAFNNELFPKKISEMKHGSFRIVESRTGLDRTKFKDQRLQLESDLVNYIHINIEKGEPDFEIRLVENDPISFIGIRLTKPKQSKLHEYKGSLNKSIAYILIEHSEPDKEDIFLDPFCGTGIIPFIRSSYCSYKQLIASDIEIKEIKIKLNSISRKPKNFQLIKSDIKSLKDKLDSKVNKVVTDPPWGLIDSGIDINKLYNETFQTFTTIVNKGGIIITLTNQIEVVKNICKTSPIFKLKETSEINVSGRKSYILKIIKVK